MKVLKLILTTLVFAFGLNQGSAQEYGDIKFFIDVDNGYFEIEINETKLLKRYSDSLPAGEYTAKVWSPGYITKPINFTIVAGKLVEKHVKMVKNNNFMQYESEYKDYRMEFHKHLTVPLSISLVSTITSGIFMANAYSTKKIINTDINLYYKSPNTIELDAIKLRIQDNNKKYNRQRTAFYINSGVTLGLIGATIWSYKRFNKNYTEPTYLKDSPFKDKYSFNLTPYGCSFTINI